MATSRPASRQPIPPNARGVFKGKLFDVFQWDQRLFDGSVAIFEKLKRPDTAYVIPVSPDGKLILAEQVQPGATPAIGLLGGRIEDGETPEDGARRELLEEAGMVPGELILWDSYQFLPKIDWAIYTFIARACQRVTPPSLDAGENIHLVELSFDDFLHLVAEERFGDLEVALRVLRLASDSRKLAEARRFFGV